MKPIAILTAFALALSGCAATQAPVPDQNYFRLAAESSPPAVVKPLLDGLLMVEELRSDGVHSERALLYSEDRGHRKINQYHYDFWSDPPTRLIQSYLVKRLRAAGVATQVTRYDINGNAAAFVGGRIERFEQLIDDNTARAIVALELQLSYPGDGRPRLLKEYLAEVPLAGTSPEAVIVGIEQALNRIIDQFLIDTADIRS